MIAEIPTWLEAGQPVALISGRRLDRIKLASVARFTKTRVVLEGGMWFPLDRLRRDSGGGWGETTYLADPNDPSVVARLRVQQIRGAVGQMFSIIRDMSAAPTDEQMTDLHRLAMTVATRTGKAAS